VAAHAGPRHLLAGWLADRLGLDASRLERTEAVHASVRLHAVAHGRRARFVVERRSDDPVVRARVEIGRRSADEEVALLPEHGLTRSLAEALGQSGHDPVYERALAAAVALEGAG
jgi:glucose-6-phosphate dehydrogenase assembly protein OpcA